jgi:metal transporter CNNM
MSREIIDESDVFIDVHKAIRRMAPAPKSRVPKGRIIEEPPMLALEAAETPQETDGQSRMPSVDRRRSSVEAPPPRFHMRLQTSDKNSDSTDGFLTHRGTTDEIREHLKHLGPSNLASRPRQTRYQNVKIKRASGSPSRSGHTDMDSGHSTSGSQIVTNASATLTGGIGAGLLQSGIDARDGVQAVKLSYGTMNNRAPDNGTISIPEAVREEQDDKPPSRTSIASTTSSDLRNRPEERVRLGSAYLHKGPARSGSITEQIVDVNGIRKVVLHTTSSNTSSDDEQSSMQQAKFPVRADGQLIDLDDEHSAPAAQTNGHKKKKRRRKHKSHPKSTDGRPDEEAPLLS